MDKSWQINCSSTWQPSITPSLPSSSHLPQQGSRNQMEMNAGHCFHPFAAQEFSLLDGGVIQEPMVFNALNSSSCKSCKPELANSFLALLSGSSPQLQCDFQQLSNSKSVKAASKLPVHDSSIVVSSAGYVPITPIMSFSQHQSNGMTGNAAELCPVPFRTAATANCGRASVLHDNLQMTSLNVQTSDSAKTVVHHKVGGSEMGMDLRRGWFSSTNPANACHPHTANLQASPKIPSEAKAVISDHSSALKRTHPRVFCLGTSGDLLLSSTGLLGVVCSCHNLHLSLSKFCEHSGLRVVNPGDAVRLESGETVAQWRRLYFHKIGIRVPDDHSGWDWPEEFSATGGLVKCRATMTNMTKKSDIFQPVDSYGGITRSGQYRNNFVSPKNPHTGLSVVEKSTNKVMHTAQQRNAQDGHNLLNSLISTPHSILPALADSQIMEESPMSRGLPMSNSALNKGQQDDGYQSISEYIDYITKGSNLLISNPSLGSLKLLGTDSDGNRCNSSREGFVMDRDSISSNIELRLGQPSQQSHTMAGSILSTMGPQPFDTLGDSQKPLCQDHAIHDTINTRLTEDFSQNLWRASLGTPNINGRETESQLNLAHYAIGGSNAVEPTKLLKGDTAKNSLISMFLQHPRTPYEGSIRSQAANNLVNSSECLMPRVLDGESHIGKCDPAYFPWNRNDGTERKLNINGMALHNHIDKGKGVRLVDNCSYVAAKASSTFVNKQMANSSPFTGVIAGHYIPSNSAVQSSYLVQSSPMLPNANNPTTQLGKASCLGNSGHLDHALRSMYSFPGTAGSGVPLPPVSMGFSSATSISRPNLAPALPNKEGIDVSQHLLDENLRFHVLRHIVELSKQDHAIASNEMNPEQRLLSPSTMEMQRKGSIEGPLASEELSKIPYLTIKQDGSEVVKPLQSCSNRGLGGGVEKLADVAEYHVYAGLNNWSNFSTSTQGISLCSKDLDIQCPPSHGPHFYKQPLLRLGDRAKCFHKEPNTYFPGKCTCAVHSMCLANSCISRGETSLGAYTEHTGSVTGKDSQLIASIFDKGHVISEERAIAVGLCENLRRQIPINKDCHTTQWRDVPRKVVGGCNASRNERPAEVLDARGNVEDHLADTAAKGFKGASQAAESLKEQQMSNVCSGCSAPAVTEVSIEVNNMDSCTGDAGVARYVNDLIVDEGSGIEKCWSSDDVLDSERSIDTLTVAAKTNSTKKGSSSGLPTQSSRGFFDEFKLKNSFRLKKERNQLHTGFNVHDNIHCTQQIERDLKIGKKKKVMKWKKLDTSFPVSGLSSVHYDSPECAGHSEMHSCSSKEMHIPSRSANGTSTIRGMYSSGPSSLKRKRSALSSALALSWKRNLHGLDGHRRDSEDDYQKQSEGDANLVKIPKLSGEKKLKWDCTANMDRQFRRQDMNLVETEKAAQYTSVGCMKSLSNNRVNTCGKKARPIVCGNSGIISNGKLAEGVAKPPKVVSLSMILKTAKRCTLTENELIPTSMSERKKSKLRNKGRYDAVSILKKERQNVSLGTLMKNEVEPGISMIKTKKVYFSRNEVCADELSLLKKESDNGRHRKRGVLHRLSGARLKPRFKETRKRSLYELTRKGKKPGSAKFSLTEISKSKLQSKCISRGKLCLKDAEDSQHYTGELCQVNAKKSIKDHMCQAFVLDSDAFCCVCGSSNTDDMNFLLECSHCSIKVHQACYGVSKVPKGHWSCRPCRTSSKNIVCVLCGYEGGAMTRALRSRNIVKSLLKAWKNLSESKSSNSNPLSKTWQDELGVLDASRSGHEADSVPVMRPTNIESFPMTLLEMDLLNQMDVVKTSNVSSGSLQVHNTVTAGVLDPTVKQWVHMVCGLWTPGTRCPNVDTMSAFDVSGALHPKKKAVCSMCDRPGGLCIQCRVGNCSVQFHPWCAHQKGLLQSEVEGVDNDKVGFYGRCMLHATRHRCVSDSRPVDTKMDSPEQKDFTCARTEGYKGRKREGFRHNLHWQSSDNGGCLVPQEQINAWLHINGQKSCTRGLLKPPASDIEYDCRKEYARYKQAKGWKHLVVYKSGIHALGLYTSRFISRGAMVVEYVGEIVGLRVADKREIEYQSGRKLQYKSACYFFRIDKEHIIDATRKGGIARFVNHSCLPNCVAKVISVRNEKKVVFFAERDINPGEEITYDYHFNHEDEGKKIPCFCNSKNCRRYLN